MASGRRLSLPRWLRQAELLRRKTVARQLLATSALLALSLLVAFGMSVAPRWVPPATMLLVILVGVFELRLTGMVVLCAALLVEVAVLGSSGRVELPPGALLVYLVGVALVLAFAWSRGRLGLQGAASDLMLVDLRDRLKAHGRIPALPPPWRVDAVVRAAYAEAFSGDFVVASRARSGQLLEIALVDVSGKGQEAGVRSLLLSGAFGGLLGTLPPEGFLPAANRYLLHQDWAEGFATAVHLAVWLESGVFWVSTAGHPPPVQLHAGSGRIQTLDTLGGPALGIVSDPSFGFHNGVIQPGDTVMLYTDGLVETPGADVYLGIDRLMGEAERFIATGSGDAESVIAGVRTGETDDRALILVHRE